MKLKKMIKLGGLMKKAQLGRLAKIGALSGKIAFRNKHGRKLFTEPDKISPPEPRVGKL